MVAPLREVVEPAVMPSVVEIYQRTKKLPDLPWNRLVCRPLAAVVVRGLIATRVTPNQITLLAFALAAVAAALLAAWPGTWGLVVGVLLYELSYVLDCADGMLARWRGIASKSGHLLDFLMDELKALLILGAVSVRLHLETGSTVPLLLGVGGLVVLATGVSITTFQRREEIAGPPAPSAAPIRQPPLLVRLPLAVAKLLVHYPSYIWLAAVTGRVEIYFYPYLAVNALYALKSLAWIALRFGRFERA